MGASSELIWPEPARDRAAIGAVRIVVTGAAAATGLPCDPAPHLLSRKMRKFMGPQDDLAVVAATRAASDAGLKAPLGDRVGLFLAVGYLPFEAADMDALHAGSLDAQGRFDMARFSTAGYQAVNPLLTFRCLSNMPAFHASLNLGITGPYAVLYPTAAETYAALEEAVLALEEDRVDVALWGGVAHQRNALVEHHHARIRSGVLPADLLDAAAFAVLERESRAAARGAPLRARLLSLATSYAPHDVLERPPPAALDLRAIQETDTLEVTPASSVRDAGAAGPVLSLVEGLAVHQTGRLHLRSATRTGVVAGSTWEVRP